MDDRKLAVCGINAKLVKKTQFSIFLDETTSIFVRKEVI